MTKADLIRSTSEASGRSQKDCLRIIDAWCKLLSELMFDGKKVELRDYFTFEVRTRKMRPGNNPRTGILCIVPEHEKAVCRFSPTIRKGIVKP